MTKEEKHLLSSVYLFEGLPQEGQKLLWEASDERRLRGGEVLFQQGQLADCGYLILSGSLLLATTPTTHEEIVKVGGFVGEMALLIDQRRHATAISRGDTRVLRISGQAYKKIAAMFPEVAYRAGQGMQRRLNAMIGELEGVQHKLMNI